MEAQAQDSSGVAARRSRLEKLFPAALGLFWAVAPLAHHRALESTYDLPKKAVAGIAGLMLAATVMALGRRWRDWVLPLEALALAGFGIVAAVSVALSAAPAEGATKLMDLAAHAAWWFLGWRLLGTGRALGSALLGVAVGAALSATLGILQHYHLDSWGEGPVGGLSRLLAELPMTDAPGSTFGHVNVAAEFVLAGLLAGLGLAFRWQERGMRWGFLRASPVLLAGGVFLVVSGTRAAWLGLLGGAAAYLGALLLCPVDRRGARRKLLMTGAVGLLVAVGGFLALDQVVTVPGRGGSADVAPSERLLQSETIGERLVLWDNTLAMSADHPLLGVGPGNWKIMYPAWARTRRVHPSESFGMHRQPARVHNDPLQLLAETGWLGFVAMGTFFLLALRHCLRAATRDLGAGSRPYRAALGVIAGLLTVSLFSFPFEDAMPGPLVFLLLGAGSGTYRGSERSRGIKLSPGVVTGTTVVTLFLLATAILFHRGRLLADASLLQSRQRLEMSRHRSHIGAPSDGVQNLMLQALDAVDRAAAREPANYRFQLQRAAVLQELGLADRAAAVHERILELHPHLVHPLLSLAHFRRQEGDWAEARRLLARAAAIVPGAPELNLAYGLHFHSLGLTRNEGEPEGRKAREQDWNQAERHYRRAISGSDWNPDARIALARLILERNTSIGEVARLVGEARTEAWGNVELPRSGDYSRLVDCARLASDSRLEALQVGLFGPDGRYPHEMWKRVLVLSRGHHSEARLEISLLKFRQALRGAPMPPASELKRLLDLVEDILSREPLNLKAVYYGARLQEEVGDHRQAQLLWGRLLRTAPPRHAREPWVSWLLDEAVQAQARMAEKPPPEKERQK